MEKVGRGFCPAVKSKKHRHTQTDAHSRIKLIDGYCYRNVEAGLREGHVTFTYVRARTPRIVLLVEDTNVMNLQVSRCGRWWEMRCGFEV